MTGTGTGTVLDACIVEPNLLQLTSTWLFKLSNLDMSALNAEQAEERGREEVAQLTDQSNV